MHLCAKSLKKTLVHRILSFVKKNPFKTNQMKNTYQEVGVSVSVNDQEKASPELILRV